MRAQGETRELVVELTHDEIESRGRELALAVQCAAESEEGLASWLEQMKRAKKSMVSDVDSKKAEANRLAEVVNTGKEKREVACTWKHAIAAGWRFLVRDDTGERIGSVRLKDEERQMVLGEAPYAEPTPDELAEWLAALPVNEPDALGEGHAETVTAEERLVGALLDPAVDESFGPSSDELTGEEQTRAYEQEMWEADADEDGDTPIKGELVVSPLEEEF